MFKLLTHKFPLIALAILVCDLALGFPDMIRHQYVNCNSCHISPTGGGILNPYGRMMSGEVLSTWRGERESEFLHGLLPEETVDAWLLGGGDVRVLQVHRESPGSTVGRGFLMQANLDLAARYKSLTAVISVGEPDQESRTIKPLPRQFYLMWYPHPEVALRVGRFMPAFGIHTPYHTLPTRGPLGFGPGGEKDTLEAYWNGMNWDLGVGIARPPDENGGQSEDIATFRVNRHFGKSSEVGTSFLYGIDGKQQALSLHGTLGFIEKLAYLSEFTFAKTPISTDLGLYHFSQLFYEVRQGVGLYLLEDYQKADLSRNATLQHSLGAGVRWLPRPHFEVDLLLSQRRVAAFGNGYHDLAWMTFHYYF